MYRALVSDVFADAGSADDMYVCVFAFSAASAKVESLLRLM